MVKVTDAEIIRRFFDRDESAIRDTQDKYSRYCGSIAHGLLASAEDAGECLNDTWLRAWNTIPPENPQSLRAYLGKITRNLAVDRIRRDSAAKRGGKEAVLALDELAECESASADDVEEKAAQSALGEVINRFLDAQDRERRALFVERYYYADSIADIAAHHSMSESAVKVTLFRMRKELKKELERRAFL
ncbi:MAG: RNA polymerase sigma factor [Lachnospiraceae bacterium]|nr:RNA polymerase sigma factor [Lachnospiraceae bacterium]